MTIQEAKKDLIACYGSDFTADTVYDYCENYELDFTPYDFGLRD